MGEGRVSCSSYPSSSSMSTMSFLLLSLVLNTFHLTMIYFNILYDLSRVVVKTTSLCLYTQGKSFSYYSSKFGPDIPGFSLRKILTSSLAFSNPSVGSPVVSISEHHDYFTKYRSCLNFFFPPNLPRVGDQLNLYNFLNLSFHVAFDIFRLM